MFNLLIFHLVNSKLFLLIIQCKTIFCSIIIIIFSLLLLLFRYLVAYAPLDSGEQKLTIFDIRTGAEKRSFISDAPMAGPVPILRWSKDDKYFARIGHNTLSVYETPVSI